MPIRLPSHQRFWWALFAIWFVTLQVLSSLEGSGSDTQLFPQMDKMLHLLYFGAGGAALAIALRLRWEGRTPYWKPLIWASVISMGAVVGAFDEWHQSFVKNRSENSLADWFADILGCVLACALLPLYWKFLAARRGPAV